MAQVVLARQRGPKGFQKLVVIKKIHPHLAEHQYFTDMFLDEARIAAQLNHPNVVQIYELGEADGTYFIAMEYLAGESLGAVIREGAKQNKPLTPLMAARLIADAAAGLHAAHDLHSLTGEPMELVHRDVSPGNIVVLYNGSVKVVDFGVAKARGKVAQTTGGELKGKFAYMPPEQLINKPVDRRSDIFSLGIVLWEALSLRRLFKGDNEGATVAAILAGASRPPSSYRPEVPTDLDAIAMRALARDPADRFVTAHEMREALDECIHSHGVRVRSTDIKNYVHDLFADRIEARTELIERAASGRAAPDEAAIGFDDRDGSADGSDSSSLGIPHSIGDVMEDASFNEIGDVPGLPVEAPAAPVPLVPPPVPPPLWGGDDTVQELQPLLLSDSVEDAEPEIIPPAEVAVHDAEDLAFAPPRSRAPWMVALVVAGAVVMGGLIAFLGGGDANDPEDVVAEAVEDPDPKSGDSDDDDSDDDDSSDDDSSDDDSSDDADDTPRTAGAVGPGGTAGKPDGEPPTSAGPDPGATAASRPKSATPTPPKKPGPVKKPTGKLYIASMPRAEVFRGKKSLGMTPLVGKSLPVGKHRLTLVDPESGAKRTVNVEISAGKDTRVLKEF